MHAYKTNTCRPFLFVFDLYELRVHALHGAAGPNVEHRKKKEFKLKLEPVKTQICSLKPRPFHPKNDAAVDEDPVKDKAMTQWKHLLPYVCCAFRLLRTNGHWPHEAHADNIRAWVQTAWKAADGPCEAKWESGLKVFRGVRSNPQHLYKSTPLPWRCWRAAKQFFLSLMKADVLQVHYLLFHPSFSQC